jgi:hypothetical protein
MHKVELEMASSRRQTDTRESGFQKFGVHFMAFGSCIERQQSCICSVYA